SSRLCPPGGRRSSRGASLVSSRARCATSRVPFCGPLAFLLLLRRDRRLQCCDRALSVRVRVLELECGLELLELPALRLLVDVRHREIGVAARRLRPLRLGGYGLLLRRRGRALRGGADRLDLDLRERGAEASLAPVAGLRAALADPHLVATDMADDLRRHLDARREIPVAVATGEEHIGMERLPFVGAEAVDQQPLAPGDAVLLATE